MVVLALGAPAGLAALGRKPAVMKERGEPIDLDVGATAILTVHPSYLLRLPNAAVKAEARAQFVSDLKIVRHHLR